MADSHIIGTDGARTLYNRPNRSNLLGIRFGYLIAVADVGSDSAGNRIWLCQCSACGGEYRTRAGYLLKVQRRGSDASCGCRRQSKRTTHGLSKHPVYTIWFKMMNRCYKPEHDNFKHYGGRGIKVCERWQKFEAFWEDFGNQWAQGLSIDRIDVNGDYKPENCRWASQKTQCNNKRNNRILQTPVGPMTFAQACDHFGIDRNTVQQRIDNLGWSIFDALTRPKRAIVKNTTSANSQ